jgi:hypothetical protein
MRKHPHFESKGALFNALGVLGLVEDPFIIE